MTFSRDIERLTDKYIKRAEAVYRQSVQDLVDDAQTPKMKGGRLPVDLGFLRASGGSALDSMPSGVTTGATNEAKTGDPLLTTLARWKPGQAVYWGWSAIYARVQEYRNGFSRGAAEKWQRIVNRNARRVGR